MTKQVETYEFTAVMLRATDRAVQVTETGEEKDAIWLPLSQAEIEPGQRINGVLWSKITVPAWIAEQRGLV